MNKPAYRKPWFWVPSLYYAQGIPYVIVMTVSVIFYKKMGLTNTDIALYTSWLYLPWVLKPLWSPFVDLFKTKRLWIVSMQFILGVGLAGIAFTIPLPHYLQYTLAFFFLMAFSSATHDIAADGFYMLALPENEQSFYVGIRSTFYRFANITGQGLLIVLAGWLELSSGLPEHRLTVADFKDTTAVVQSWNNVDTTFEDLGNSDLSLLVSNKEIKVSDAKLNKRAVDSLKTFYHNQNYKNGFLNEYTGKELAFAPTEKDAETLTGNVAVISFKLSHELTDDESYILNVNNLVEADTNIVLLAGSNIAFHKNNWDKPAFAVIQLKHAGKTAEFKALASDLPSAWRYVFIVITAVFFIFVLYHFFVLPYPAVDVQTAKRSGKEILRDFVQTFVLFFKKKNILLSIAFLLIYRFGEAQLVKLASPFLLDPRDKGGLGLTTSEVGLVYGTLGVGGLILGGIIGGMLVSKGGLKKWIWWMFASINIPHILYIYLAYFQPTSLAIISGCVALEQFGYGFGFTAYMLYMIYVSEGELKTSHYALCTGFMALSMMIPGLFSGWIQEQLGYKLFFVYILLTMIPGFFITKILPIDKNFGKK